MSFKSSRRLRVSAEKLQTNLECEVIDGPAPFDIDNPTSRAVGRIVVQGVDDQCVHCGEQIRFRPGRGNNNVRILANLYDEDGKWQGIESYYPPKCYDEAGAPYGPVYTMPAGQLVVDNKQAVQAAKM